MEEKLFREKSVQRISTPEQLTSYLKVTGFGVWMALAGIIALLIGLLIWGLLGSILTTVDAPALAKDGVVSVYLLEEDLTHADGEVKIAIGDVEITAKTQDAGAVTLDSADNPALYESGYLSPGKTAKVLTGETGLTDGYYEAVVTTERLKPISLLFASGN